MIVRTAFDGKANYIVLGDKHLLSLGTYRGIRIINVDEMLTLEKRRKSSKLEVVFSLNSATPTQQLNQVKPKRYPITYHWIWRLVVLLHILC